MNNIFGLLYDTLFQNARPFLYTRKNYPVNAIIRLPHFQNGNSLGKETFLALSADNQARNYDIEYPNLYPSWPTLKSKWSSCSKMKRWVIYAHTNLPLSVVVRLPHPRSGDS